MRKLLSLLVTVSRLLGTRASRVNPLVYTVVHRQGPAEWPERVLDRGNESMRLSVYCRFSHFSAHPEHMKDDEGKDLQYTVTNQMGWTYII